MAVPWLKLRATFATNGKVGEAGHVGALVYVTLLCMHLQHGEGGVLRRDATQPRRLRVEGAALLADFCDAEVEQALQACVAAGLVAIDETRSELHITGWDEDSMPTCSHCRKPNPQPRFGSCPTCRKNSPPPQMRRRCAADAAPDRTRPDQTIHGLGTRTKSTPSTCAATPVAPDATPLGDLRSRVDGVDGLGLGRRNGGGRLPAQLIRLGFAAGSQAQMAQVIAFAKKLDDLHDAADIDELLVEASKGRNPAGLLQTWVKRDETEKVLARARSRSRT